MEKLHTDVRRRIGGEVFADQRLPRPPPFFPSRSFRPRRWGWAAARRVPGRAVLMVLCGVDCLNTHAREGAAMFFENILVARFLITGHDLM